MLAPPLVLVAALSGPGQPLTPAPSASPPAVAPSPRPAASPLEPNASATEETPGAPVGELDGSAVAPTTPGAPAGELDGSAEAPTTPSAVGPPPPQPAVVSARPLTRRQRAGKAPISVRLKTIGELGALSVLAHHLKLDSDGTNFDLRRDGRQDTMFLFGRLSAELEIDDHHEIILLYQPLSLRTTTVLTEDLVADEVTFAAGTGIDIFYGFDFYRLSYAYDFFTDPNNELALGFSMQVRNFRQSYVSTDGEAAVANSNIGPVPVIKLRGRHQLPAANFWYGAEVDAFYANIPFINGGDDPVEGLIVDASVRAGVTVAKHIRPFANLRYLGGGGKGTSSDKVGFGDGYNSNWLHTLAFSLGAELTIPALAGDRPARDREVAARKARRRAGRRR